MPWLPTRSHTTIVSPATFAGRFRFLLEAIAVAVRWYLRYGVSCRDAGELLAERGVTVDHVTVYRWCSGSRLSSSRRRGRAGMLRVTGGSPMRFTSRWPAGGLSVPGD
jgi:hypothetical protein